MSETIDTVYHYCNLETLLSIFHNKTIRLSDINKSNDYLETKSTIDSIKKAIVDLCNQNSIDKYQQIMLGIDNESAIKHLIDIVLNRFINYKDTLVYAACFSEIPDLLSQWCEYADNGKGVAIGFNVECLKKICESSEDFLKFKQVRYIDEKNSFFDEMINKYANEFYGEIISALINGTLDELFTNPYGTDFEAVIMQQRLIRDSVFTKHESFSAEKEWRIVLEDEELQKTYDDWENYYNWNEGEFSEGLMKLIPKGLKFRSIGDDIISYLDLSFKEYKDEVINCIYIGPNCKAQIDDIYHIIQHFGFCNFDTEHIYLSKSPYRSIKI